MMTGSIVWSRVMWVEGEVVATFRGGTLSLLDKKKNKIHFLKWHTATSAGYFSPYTFTLNMINNGTHWGRRKTNKNTVLCTFSKRSHLPASLPSKTFALRAVVLLVRHVLVERAKGKKFRWRCVKGEGLESSVV